MVLVANAVANLTARRDGKRSAGGSEATEKSRFRAKTRN